MIGKGKEELGTRNYIRIARISEINLEGRVRGQDHTSGREVRPFGGLRTRHPSDWIYW